jgi:hypothetical protein
MKAIHRAKQRSNQHKRKHSPKSNHHKGLILGRGVKRNGAILNAFKK